MGKKIVKPQRESDLDILAVDHCKLLKQVLNHTQNWM